MVFDKLVHICQDFKWLFKAGKSLYGEKAMLLYVQLSTNCGLGYPSSNKNIFSLQQWPILQLVDNCTYGTMTFPLYKDFTD